MSTSAISSDTSSVQDLARTLMRDYDTNADGQFSSAEFASLLSGLIHTLVGAQYASTSDSDRLSTASAPLLTSIDTSSTSAATTTATSSTGSTAASSSATGTTAFRDRMLGFDYSRFESAKGSLKYDAANIMMGIDPGEPGAMQKVYEQMNRMHPGQVSLDKDGNLMLDGTADGYIGVRPLNRDEDWSNPPSGFVWQWMAYNSAHPGPNGEGL